jgi:transcription termination/antitermination protein NusG
MKDEKGTLIPLQKDDRSIISTLTIDGEIAGPSTVIFDKNNRVKVLKGPLMGQEGRIIKVDRRKRRITVAIEFADKRFKIDLAYQEAEKQSEHKGTAPPRKGPAAPAP